jgi:4-amino-4-deoxy-L-arabinose transferase
MLYQLVVSALIFLPSIVATVMGRRKEALWLLLFAAFVIRLMMIGLDPYLHNWDERFHAVVAKNMMQHPLKPMMRMEAILPYNIADWCCNYIWVHKQPLFLWQMALSMKIFGVNTIALRLPNVIMETFAVYCIYRTATIWTRNSAIAYLSALLFAASYYSLELCSGRMSLDHNDVMMGGYVTASIWAFCEYTENKTWKWAILVGVFSGCAILVKWLTGLLIFGGWGIYLLADNRYRSDLQSYKHLAAGSVACLLVFLPWQLYIRIVFPAESAACYAYNYKHIFEDLDHPGTVWTHIEFMSTTYSGILFLAFMFLGMLLSWRRSFNKHLSFAMLSMFIVVYGFFSFVVATKMPGLTFPVSGIGFIWIAVGLQFVYFQGEKLIVKIPSAVFISFATLTLFSLALYSFQPQEIAQARKPDFIERNAKIHNTEIYKKLNHVIAPDVVILNCKSFEDTEVRFWQPNNAYHWYPDAHQVDSLLNHGYKLAAFKNHNNQALPEYMIDPRIKIIDLQLE